MSNKENNKKIARNTVFLYLRMAIVMVVTLYTVRVVLQSLGVVDYGIYNVLCGFVAMFAVLNSTLSNAVQRFYNFEIGKIDSGDIRTLFNTAVRIQLCIAVVIFILLEIIGVWYLHNKMVIPNDRMYTANWVLQFSIISSVFSILQIPFSAAVSAYERMDYLAFVGILDAGLKLAIAYLIQICSGDKLLIYAFLILLISLVNFCLYSIYSFKNFHHLRLQKNINNKFFRPLFGFSGWMLLDPLSYTLKNQGSNMALNFFHGPVMNTAYGLSMQASQSLESFSFNISMAFKPQIIQSYSSRNFKRTKILFISMSKIMFLLKFLLCVPLIFEADYLLHLWLGADIPQITITFTQLLVIINVINGFAHPITVVISATGIIRKYMILTSITVGLVLPMSILYLLFWGNAVGVYWIMLVSAVLNLFISVIVLNRVFPYISIVEYLKSVIVPCFKHIVLVLPIPFIFYSLAESGFSRFLIIALLSVTLSMVSSYIAVLDQKEKGLVRNMVLSFKQKI